jgi:hypothetical protein
MSVTCGETPWNGSLLALPQSGVSSFAGCPVEPPCVSTGGRELARLRCAGRSASRASRSILFPFPNEEDRMSTWQPLPGSCERRTSLPVVSEEGP